MPPLVHRPGIWVISSRMLRLPLVLPLFSVEGFVGKFWPLHLRTIYVPFVSVSRSLRPCGEQPMCPVLVPIAIQDQGKTYASFLFANEAPLSLGFFAAAAFFCAFWRSCSR